MDAKVDALERGEGLVRAGQEPLYLQLSRRLRGVIACGMLDRLPPERTLARSFSVSRVTVRAALRLLAEDDLICRRTRRGTLIRARFER